MLFEAVFAIGGIGATIDSKVNLHDGIFFSSIAILWFVISFLGIFELKAEKKAKTEQQKADLFDTVRSGEIRVLIGSTAKMGTGTNVQKKLITVQCGFKKCSFFRNS